MEPDTTMSLDTCAENLNANGFETFIATTPEQAREIFFEQILPEIDVKSAAWGDSLTMHASGVPEALLKRPDIEVIRTFGDDLERAEKIRNRRQALHVDLFMAGCNAISAGGQVVNLDMIGNRVGPIAYGPHHVVLFAGRNKLTPDLPTAMERVRNVAAPSNAKRHGLATPCAKTGRCHDCSSPQRICNTWVILEKSFPPGRVKVVLIDDELGL
ncbi:MAG: lactate utilization protein [Desulfuromonas sp.]|nr:MAG: lactate utilization protein [Desulfuromonas sp.]